MSDYYQIFEFLLKQLKNTPTTDDRKHPNEVLLETNTVNLYLPRGTNKTTFIADNLTRKDILVVKNVKELQAMKLLFNASMFVVTEQQFSSSPKYLIGFKRGYGIIFFDEVNPDNLSDDIINSIALSQAKIFALRTS